MERLNRWWLTLIGVGMVAYAAAVVWGQVARLRFFAGAPIEWQSLIPAVLIGVVGVIALVFELLRQPDDPRPHLLAQAMESYIAAWRRLWGTKWLLWLYGSIAAIAASGSVAQSMLVRHYMPERFVHSTLAAPGLDATRLLMLLQDLVKGAFDAFIPSVPFFPNEFGYAAAALVTVVLVLPRVSRLSREPRCEGKTGFFAFCMVLAALSCVAVPYAWMVYLARIASASGSGGHDDEMRFTLVYMEIAGLVAAVILSGALTAGVLGSLARSRDGDQDAKRTFLPDAVRFFAPLAGFCLIIDLAVSAAYLPYYLRLGSAHAALSSWPPILHALISIGFLLLMFAPFGIVTRGLGLGKSISHSVGVWKQTWRNAIVLIAVGSFLYAVAMAPGGVMSVLVGRSSWTLVPWGAVSSAISVAVRALMLLAAWEFYVANVQEPRGVVEEGV